MKTELLKINKLKNEISKYSQVELADRWIANAEMARLEYHHENITFIQGTLNVTIEYLLL
jgi:hypothetical protein